MERSNMQATMIYSDVLYGGEFDKTLDGPVAFIMKWSFDFYYNIIRGHMPPDVAEKLLVKYLSKKISDLITPKISHKYIQHQYILN